jgi:hypothetical protein
LVRGGEGRRSFLKKNPEAIVHFGFGLTGRAQRRLAKVFGSFFQKKALVLLAPTHQPRAATLSFGITLS